MERNNGLPKGFIATFVFWKVLFLGWWVSILDVKIEELYWPRGQNEAATRLWINAFFFRVATMSQGNSKIILSVEQKVLPVAMSSTSLPSLAGFVDYKAILTTKACSEFLFCLSLCFRSFLARVFPPEFQPYNFVGTRSCFFLFRKPRDPISGL